jgi:low temperature requirement protein LtrA
VLVGAFPGGGLQYAFWGIAILLDLWAAALGGSAGDWHLRPEHFTERHGLFVIIALGESLIVAAGSVSGAAWEGRLLAIAVLAVAVTCSLWWSYFARAKPVLDRAVERGLPGSMARDAYSIWHFPLLLGVVAYAAAVEEALTHPHEALPLEARLALAAGLLLFIGGLGAALRRATGHFPLRHFLIVLAASMFIAALPGISPLLALGIAFIGVAGAAVVGGT